MLRQTDSTTQAAGLEAAPAAPGATRSRSGDLGYGDLVAFARRHGRPVALFAVLGAVVVLALAYLLIPERYSATATLAVIPSTISSELVKNRLPIQGYQTLLESDAVLERVRTRLVEENALEQGIRLEIGKAVQSRVFISRRQDTITLSPLIQVIGRARSPETAALIANTWAEEFLALVREHVIGATVGAAGFVEEEFARTREALETAESGAADLHTELQALEDAAAAAWDDRIARAKKAGADEVAAHSLESRRLMEEFLESSTRRLAQAGLAAPGPDSAAARLAALVAVRLQLAQSSPVVSLEKAISDDAVWESLLVPAEEGSQPLDLWNRSLVTEEANPAYAPLVQRAIDLEVELRREHPFELVGALASEAEKLQLERAAELASLRARQRAQLAKLERQRAAELTALGRDRLVKLGDLEREVARLARLEERLSTSHDEVVLAEAQEQVDEIRLAAAAVPPRSAESRSLPVKGVLGGLLGAFVGLVFSVFRAGGEQGSRRGPRAEPAAPSVTRAGG